MPFDGVVIKAVTEELQEKLIEGRISKIYQPTSTELVFTIRNKRQNHTLLLSIHPMYARFHLTEDTYRNPQEPPMFCMLLRKHLSGAVVESIKQTGLERIVTINLRAIDEIGDSSYKKLVLEIMGRHSNVLLLDENKEHIIDSLKHVPPLQNSYRTILPGQKYIEPPSQNKQHPLKITGDEFIKQLDFNAGKLDRQIVHMLDGISPFLAKEIVYRAKLASPDVYKEKFLEVRNIVKEQAYEPTIYRADKEEFHVIPITYYEGDQLPFASANKMLDAFYSGKAERDRVKQRARDLERFIKNELEKNNRKMAIHRRTIKRAKQAELSQRRGELLTANMHLVSQGDASITVIDYYDPEQGEIEIPLQTDKTPSENAQNFFTRYRKLKRSAQIVRREIIKTRLEIKYLEQILHQLNISNEEGVDEIREELRSEGYLKKQRQSRRKKQSRSKPEQYISTDGTLILVGKNNNQNEYITHRLAHRNDVWLHTKDIPGSHVIIRSSDPDEATLQEAAQLAAYFSQAQQSASVPVDYTQVRHVKKPRGAKPGYVTYDNQKTLFVTPKKEIVKTLKKD